MTRALPRERPPAAVPITLSEEGGVRYLHFGTPWVQGAMRLARPDEPVIEYVQQMMAWLLFLDAPAQLLQLGLGAGALTRFCLRHCADTQVTVVECSEEVVETAHQWFALPRDHPRLSLVLDDAMDFLDRPSTAGRFGVLQVDLYDMHARGPAIESAAFYRLCALALAPTGIAVFNLFGEHASTARNLQRIERAFGGRTLRMPPCAAGNLVALAFAGPPLSVDWETLARRARMVARQTRLPAPGWVSAMRRTAAAPMLAV